MSENLDLRISEADPARNVRVLRPGFETIARRTTRHTPSRRRSRPLLITTGATLTAAAMSIAVLLAVTKIGGRPIRATIEQLTVAAAHYTGAQPGPGEYVYTKSVADMEVTVRTAGGPAATATFPATIESWESTTPGSGHQTVTPTGPFTFTSAQDRAAWASDPLSRHWTSPASLFLPSGGPNAEAPLDESALPTTTAALSQELTRGSTGIPAVDSISGPNAPYQRTLLLLTRPATGSTPALQAALYRVLVALPGITTSTSTDHLGRQGIRIADTAAPNLGQLIVDPSTGQPLEIINPVPSPHLGHAPQATAAETVEPRWITIEQQQLVSSPTATS